jgi:hypothetical protein
MLLDESVMNVSSIIWATGSKPVFTLIDLKVTDERMDGP